MLYAFVLWAQDAAKGAPQEGPPPWSPLLMMVVLFGLFYFLLILPARRKERQQREALFSSLKKNDRVLTSAGIIGTVVSIKDKEDEVTLRIDDTSNARLSVLKSSIVRIYTKEDAGKGETSDAIKAGNPTKS
jgi:preprotein translocase subunit YajC